MRNISIKTTLMNGFSFNANITHMYELSFNVSTVDFNRVC